MAISLKLKESLAVSIKSLAGEEIPTDMSFNWNPIFAKNVNCSR